MGNLRLLNMHSNLIGVVLGIVPLLRTEFCEGKIMTIVWWNPTPHARMLRPDQWHSTLCAAYPPMIDFLS